MKPDDIDRGWEQVNRRLEDVARLRCFPDETDPEEYEARLLQELDALEYEAGLKYFEARNRHAGDPYGTAPIVR